ncbi:DUF1273 domain-containing protein [Listeria sp. PSOL-1]|uniref:DUF1273 domain-containing protein n=1 Tax=Listeria sp. PSOL-1 TaxID=1844999 RepID=UPI0013D07489|nr:DUF1273 domain-containing protein [Listeria sp. PSOL-1]
MKTVAVTGYKNFELGIFKREAEEVKYIKLALRRHILSFLDEGLEWVVIAGRLGTELFAAELVFELQEEGYALKLAVLEPFKEQSANWNETNQLWQEEIIAQADFHDWITKRPYENPSQFELCDQFIIDHTDGALMLYDLEKEGSPRFFYKRAKEEADYFLICIDFYELEDVVSETQSF